MKESAEYSNFLIKKKRVKNKNKQKLFNDFINIVKY